MGQSSIVIGAHRLATTVMPESIAGFTRSDCGSNQAD